MTRQKRTSHDLRSTPQNNDGFSPGPKGLAAGLRAFRSALCSNRRLTVSSFLFRSARCQPPTQSRPVVASFCSGRCLTAPVFVSGPQCEAGRDKPQPPARWGSPRDRQSTATKQRNLSISLLLLTLLVALFAGRATVLHAQTDSAQHLQDLINQVRLNEGLTPLGHSTLLTQAAQRHADDLVTIGLVTHAGSDGSTYQQRIREARYQAWDDGLIVNEVIWTGLGTAEDALTWFYANPDWAILTDAQYREIGIGYVDDNGVRYFVVTLGSRPGVLPIFINDGFPTTESPVVALRLTNEDAVPFGDATWIGKAIEIRISNTPDFDGQPWQPWEPLVPWALASEEPGDYAVYVEFRDGADRTAIAEATIRLVAPGESQPTPTPFLNLPSSPAGPTPGATPSPGEPTSEDPATPLSPEAQEPSAPATPQATGGTFTPYPTWTPLPTEAPLTTESRRTDWPLLLVVLLQGMALLLGIATFLKRN